uniref:Uncharacterized protein n=1 Tax=Triticum urartu TaxID=4572 RepID=A0A8R7TC53_TRIUA
MQECIKYINIVRSIKFESCPKKPNYYCSSNKYLL